MNFWIYSGFICSQRLLCVTKTSYLHNIKTVLLSKSYARLLKQLVLVKKIFKEIIKSKKQQGSHNQERKLLSMTK